MWLTVQLQLISVETYPFLSTANNARRFASWSRVAMMSSPARSIDVKKNVPEKNKKG